MVSYVFSFRLYLTGIEIEACVAFRACIILWFISLLWLLILYNIVVYLDESM